MTLTDDQLELAQDLLLRDLHTQLEWAIDETFNLVEGRSNADDVRSNLGRITKTAELLDVIGWPSAVSVGSGA